MDIRVIVGPALSSHTVKFESLVLLWMGCDLSVHEAYSTYSGLWMGKPPCSERKMLGEEG